MRDIRFGENPTGDQGWERSPVSDMQFKLKRKNTEPIGEEVYINPPESIQMHHVGLELMR